MQDFNNNNNVEEHEQREPETLQRTDKEKEAEKFLKSLEKDQKQVKSKSVSFKCTLEGVSIAEFLVELARKEKVKGYEEAKEDLKKIFE